MARTPLMAGNWKMNLDHLEANHLVQGLAMALSDAGHDYSKCEVLVIPPFTDIRTVQTIVDADELSIKYGAQDVSIHDNGAYTGEISTEMLSKLGVTYVEFVLGQIRAALAGWKAEEVAKIVIAYEPIWAIGTGETASAEDAQEVCGAIRAALAEDFGAETAEATRILYGGSAKPGNIKELMAQPDVDGGLVGGASLKADSFAAMANFYA